MPEIRLHFRMVLTPDAPTGNGDPLLRHEETIAPWISEQVNACIEAFAQTDADAGTDRLTIVSPSQPMRAVNYPRATVRINRCNAASLSEDQRALLQEREGLTGSDVVVVVAPIEGGWGGCAAFPDGQPGLIVEARSDQKRWMLAHEIGHVLGLKDTFLNTSHLMCKEPSWPDESVPVITQTETATVLTIARSMASGSS